MGKTLRTRFSIALALFATLTLLLLATLNFASSTSSITIKGKLEYVDELGGLSPMRRVKVYLMDNDAWEGAAVDEVVAWQYTDDDGNYEFVVDNNDGPGQDGRDPYVKVESSNPAAVAESPALGVYFMQLPQAGENVPDGFSHDYGAVHPDAFNDAWHAIDAALSARDWIWDHVSWERPTRVTIFWPSKDCGDWPLCYGDEIHLPDKSFWVWDHVTVHHEYALSVLYTLYGNSFPVGYPGPVPPRPVFFESSDISAFVVGWAEFMQCAVDNNPDNLQDWYYGVPGNIESNEWYNVIDVGDMDGAMVEGSVASILWDILDPANDDPLSLGFDEIFSIMRDYNPTDMDSFWSGWENQYPLYAGDLSTIYWMYGIDKDFYPPTGTISINSGDPYTTSTSVTLTVSASDYGSGVDKMRFTNFPNPWFWGRWFPWIWSAWRPYETSMPWTLPAGDGTKTVYAQFRDKKGLVTPLSSLASDTIILDTVPPEGSIVINTGDTYTTSPSVTLSLTYSDATSGVDSVRYSNDGVWDTEPWESPSATKAWILTGPDGEKTVYYQVRDKAGLVSATYTDTIILDTTPPTGSIIINGDDPYTKWPLVILSLTYSDATSGVDEVKYANDGELWTPLEAPSDVKLWMLRAEDGTRTVYYQIQDKAGLISAVYWDTIQLDTVPPETTIYHLAPTERGKISISRSDPAPGSGVAHTYYRIDGGSWTEYISPFWVSGAGGTRTIDAYSVDNAGNKEPMKTLRLHWLSVGAYPSGIWVPPWGSHWYTEGETATTPEAASGKVIYGGTVAKKPNIYGMYTFSTWKKDNVPVPGNPASVLMDKPHYLTATYFGTKLIISGVDETDDHVIFHVKVRITTGDTQHVKIKARVWMEVHWGPDADSGWYWFETDLPGGLDVTLGPFDLKLPKTITVLPGSEGAVLGLFVSTYDETDALLSKIAWVPMRWGSHKGTDEFNDLLEDP